MTHPRPPRGSNAKPVPGSTTNATSVEDLAMQLYQGSVTLNKIFTDNMPLLIAACAFLVGCGLFLFYYLKRKAAARGPSPDERKDITKINAVARQRTAAYMERYVTQGLNHDGFFHMDAKIPAALQAAANRFAIGGSKGGDDEEGEESNIASMIQRFQRRDDDGSGQSVALLIVADDGVSETAGEKVLQAHLSAKRLATTLETAGFATCLMSTLGEAAPTQRSCAAVLKQMQLAKRKFRSSLLYVCGRIRRVKLDAWPTEAELLTPRGHELLKTRTLEIGKAADNILELLLEPTNPTPATSWADLSILVARLAQCASSDSRPTVVLNVVWESEADDAWAMEQRAAKGLLDESSDPHGIVTALLIAAPRGLLDAVSIIAAKRVVTDAVADRKRSGDTLCNALTDAIKSGVGSAARSAALGINLGPMSRTLAETTGYHCGVCSPATLAAHLLLRQAGEPSAEVVATAPIGVRLSSCLPHALAVQPVGGPRGAQPPPMMATERLWQTAVAAVSTAVTSGDDGIAVICIADAPHDPVSARTAVSLFAWTPTTQQQFEDQTLMVDWESVSGSEKAQGTEVEWQRIMQAALDLLLGATRHSPQYAATEELFVAACAEGKVCLVVCGWLRDAKGIPACVTQTVEKLKTAQAKAASGAAHKVRLVFDVSHDSRIATCNLPLPPLEDVVKALPPNALPANTTQTELLRCRSLLGTTLALGRRRGVELLSSCTSVEAAVHFVRTVVLTQRQRTVARAILLAGQALRSQTVPVNAFAAWIATSVDPTLSLRAAELQGEIATLYRLGLLSLHFDTSCARIAVVPHFQESPASDVDVAAARSSITSFVSALAKAKKGFKEPLEPAFTGDGAGVSAIFAFLPATAVSPDEPSLMDALTSTELFTTVALGAYDAALADVRRTLQQRRLGNELQGDTAVTATEVVKHLRDADAALSSLPQEVIFQLWNRASSDLKKRLIEALPEDAAELVSADYRGDDEHDELPAALHAVCLATTCDVSRPVLSERLMDKCDEAGRAVTCATILADPTTHQQRLYVGNAAGHLLVYDIGACLDGMTEESACALAHAALTREHPVALRCVASVTSTPHKHAVVSIFKHRFKDGAVRLVSASRRDRAIVVWPTFDLVEGSAPLEVVQVLPPPHPEPPAPKKKNTPEATADVEGEVDARPSLPKDRRLIYSTVNGCSRYVIDRLLAERLPDKHESYRRPYDFEESDGRQAVGDTVLLRHFDDAPNTISFLGDRPQSAVATFSWLFSGVEALDTVTFSNVVELREAKASDDEEDVRGYLGLIVGEPSGAVSILALCRMYSETD